MHYIAKALNLDTYAMWPNISNEIRLNWIFVKYIKEFMQIYIFYN